MVVFHLDTINEVWLMKAQASGHQMWPKKKKMLPQKLNNSENATGFGEKSYA